MSDEQLEIRRVSWTGRICKILGVLAVVVLVVGFVAGWFSMSVEDDDAAGDDRFSIVFTVNKDRMMSSAREAKEEAVELKDQVNEAAKLQSVDGFVDEIDSGQRRLTITIKEGDDGNEAVTVQLDEESTVVANGEEQQLDDLAPGTKVSITYREDDGVKRAKKVTVL